MSAADVETLIKPLLLKDLRIQCRQRNLSPAGSRNDLAVRLQEHMLATGDCALRNEDGSVMSGSQASQLFGTSVPVSAPGNNYHRPEGQNVGNFLGDRPSSRVLAAPGGASSISFGFDHEGPAGAVAQSPMSAPITPAAVPPSADKAAMLSAMAAKIAGKPAHGTPAPATPQTTQPGHLQSPPRVHSPPPAHSQGATTSPSQIGVSNNNYSRPSGQNVGNFLTDKPSSRVLAPPGGGSSITFG